ncbi:tail fiber protein [Bifidobacterium bifidum]|uniref:head fiber protein n=3 Tax=Bifidobacterium TaxID=1678 RepID=UPI000659B0B0|nr:head fiber protein [Bifidobacterium bifidum]KLN86075.1 tail fiber protein [Bifidobacterium bifidum]
MRSLSYVCASTGETIPLEGPDIWAQTAEGLRGREWSYTLGYRSLTGVSRTAREAELDLTYVRCPEKVDSTRRLFDADVAAGTPGTFDADGWTTRAYVVKAEPQTITPTMVETQLTVVLLDGVWRRETTTHHDPRTDAGSGLDYPHDYPHDYGGMSILDTVANTSGMPQPIRLTIFGPCVNPYVIIGPNRYEVDATIPASSRLEIDGTADARTVIMISDTGLRTNLFAKAVRGTGRGSGTYIFEPLPPRHEHDQLGWRIRIRPDRHRREERTAMDLIVTDTNGTPSGSYASWTLDLAYGSGENDFELQCPARLKPGCRWWVDGTGWGGIVDDVKTSVTGGEGELTYHGRDWHGLLASKILEPDKGKDYLTVSGTIGTLLRTVISRIGLQDIITVTEGASKNANWRFDRYCDAWSGLSKMLRASGLRLRITAAQNGVTVDAPPITAAGDLIDSDLIDFDATLASHPINHLICLGKGELKDRIVVHWYADQKGTLSHTQTIKGADERASVYELSNADAAELETKGKTKLQELRDTGSIDVDVTGGIDLDVTGGIDLDVGDTVTGRDNTTGIRVTAEITKKIIKVKDGIPTVTYEATTASTESTGETGGGGSSSGDGHAYYAGSGLTLSNWTFSADVTAADLETVRRTATEANKAASDAAAEIGGARDLAKQAGVKADTATTTAQNALAAAQARILDITASAPVTVTRNDETAAITVAQATSSADGLMAAADKKKLDGIQSAANKYTLPVASTATLGGVKPDGRTITVGPDGTITAQSSATEASFLAAHPIGSLYWCVAGNPNDHGGTWKEIHTIIGGHVWQRLA